ncbi:carbohydrate-binding module family 13 protein [Panaeolus papilionaceus]|nr:carbohydrate-binding module family 13 protein [Panaeolus papilionaceus]
MTNHNVRSGNRYFIRNVKGGTVIDLSGADNKSIIGYPHNGGENQQWALDEVDGGWYIRSATDGRFLAVDGTPRDSASVIVRHEPYIWHIWGDESVANGVRICVPETRENVDLTNYGSKEPGTPIAIWGHWAADNQIWYFDQV